MSVRLPEIRPRRERRQSDGSRNAALSSPSENSQPEGQSYSVGSAGPGSPSTPWSVHPSAAFRPHLGQVTQSTRSLMPTPVAPAGGRATSVAGGRVSHRAGLGTSCTLVVDRGAPQQRCRRRAPTHGAVGAGARRIAEAGAVGGVPYRARMPKQVMPFLMFQGDAEEAITFYTSLFDDAEVLDITRY